MTLGTKFLYRCYLALCESAKYFGAMDPTFGAFCMLALTAFTMVTAVCMVIGHAIGMPFDLSRRSGWIVIFFVVAVLAIAIYRHRKERHEFDSMKAQWSSSKPLLLSILMLVVSLVVAFTIAYLERTW